MPAKKKRTEQKAKRGGSSTAIYFSLGAAVAGVVAALVTLLLRRPNQPTHRSAPGTGLVRVMEPEPTSPAVPDGVAPPESPDPPGQMVDGAPTGPLTSAPAGPERAVSKTDASWSPTTKYIVGVGLFLSVLFAIYVSRGSLRMIVLAALIAFVVRPMIDWFIRHFKMKRGAAIAMIYLLVLILLILIPILVVPALVQAVNAISVGLFQHAAGNMAASIDVLIQNLSSSPALSGALRPLLESLSNALTQIAAGGAPPPLAATADETVLTGALGVTLQGLADIVGPLISNIVALVFALLISIQMTVAGDLFRKAGLNRVPPTYKPEVTVLMERISTIWNSFMRGELTLMLAVGTFVWLGNWLIGTPYALALGVIAGLLEVIPSLGPLLAWLPAVLLALVFGSTRFTGMDPLVFALLVSLLYGLIQGLENQLFVPQILGDAVNLPPVVVLIGVVIFGNLFGILGILIATPTIATLAEVFDYLYGKILEGPPPPPDEDKRSLVDRVRGFAGRIRLPWRRDRKKEPVNVELSAVPAD